MCFLKAFVQLDFPPLPSASKADLQESFRDMTLHYFKSLALLIFMALQVTKRATCEDKHQVPQQGIKAAWIAQNTLTHKSRYSLQCLLSLLSLMRFLEFILKKTGGESARKNKNIPKPLSKELK